MPYGPMQSLKPLSEVQSMAATNLLLWEPEVSTLDIYQASLLSVLDFATKESFNTLQKVTLYFVSCLDFGNRKSTFQDRGL